MKLLRTIAASLFLISTSANAQTTPAPKLIVMVSIDQLSADLFAEYRGHFTQGFSRLLSGAVFPSGYQSHAATETCPGHATILSGARPSRSGVIANEWIDFSIPRDRKEMNCAEDPTKLSATPGRYFASDRNLVVPTLGEWMKAKDPGSRVVAVSGKDRSSIMMGGHKVDELWWFQGDRFVSYEGRSTPAIVNRVNASVAERIGEAQGPMDLPAFCQTRQRAIPLSTTKKVGDGQFSRAAGDAGAFRSSPEYDEAILALGAAFATEMKLGQGNSTDLLIIGASGSDYIGHTLGTRGSEMCIQLFALDQYLGHLFAVLDSTGVDYVVALTADHGGLDLPERSSQQGSAGGERVDPALVANTMGKDIAQKLGIAGPVLHGGSFGDVYVDPRLNEAQRHAVKTEAVARYRAHRQVHTVFTREEILATPSPTSPPDSWTLLDRLRASYYPGRSGDFIVVLEPRVTPIADATRGSVATHGSIWEYDRRVPVLFWRKNMAPFEQPLSIETVDIAPTLAAIAGVPIPVAIDGKCLDLDAGPGNSCK